MIKTVAEPVLDAHEASWTETMRSELLEAVTNRRNVVLLRLVCWTPSDQVMVNGGVPPSVTGMKIAAEAQV
jgi:hypothetical protein